jgi:hypothetical protein
MDHEPVEGQTEVGVPAQPVPRVYNERNPIPTRFAIGETVVCPKCKGKIPTHKKVKGFLTELAPEERFSRDPKKHGQPCPRCKGVGFVPNVAV